MLNYVKKNLSKLYNIGDALCTPDVYFNIQSDRSYTILGGGVWNLEEQSRKVASKNTILWAVGKSDKNLNVKNTVKDNKRFLEFTSRDLDLLEDKTKFLPCVSCLNTEIIREPKDEKILVFTNANLEVSAKVNIKFPENYIIATNSESKESFLSKWEQCNRVITNSYHGIYWSLLSNRELLPFGYSSKFTSATSLFDIVFPKENLYSIYNKDMFLELLKKDKGTFIKPKLNPLEKFRDLNMQFSEKLKQYDIECKLK